MTSLVSGQGTVSSWERIERNTGFCHTNGTWVSVNRRNLAPSVRGGRWTCWLVLKTVKTLILPFWSQGGKGSEEVYPANSMMITDRISNKLIIELTKLARWYRTHQCRCGANRIFSPEFVELGLNIATRMARSLARNIIVNHYSVTNKLLVPPNVESGSLMSR